MKDNRRRRDVVCSRFFWCTLFIVASCVFLTAFNFSSFRFLFSPPAERLQPKIIPTWRTMERNTASRFWSVAASEEHCF
ncbi:Glycosyltransferase family 92 protein RCOM_0530710 [Linum perenne]